ncbi:hypothetical protein AJ88_22975 [Mesorhizobium amorphae CCBAU 01583]|nr:hypothetical protein AJ88_22975 [Mesorhizobium amorphae CCBAU 01583]
MLDALLDRLVGRDKHVRALFQPVMQLRGAFLAFGLDQKGRNQAALTDSKSSHSFGKRLGL